MSKIVAAHVWVCEFCNINLYINLYDKNDMTSHLLEVHQIDVNTPLANSGMMGDNLVVSDLVVPKELQD